MKKFILSAVAAGALAIGSAASAQDIGSVLGAILGAGQQPYGSVYIDRYGRQVGIDQFGRHVLLQSNGIVGYDAWGRAIYGNVLGSGNRAVDQVVRSVQLGDNDGDGVLNMHDRLPNDPANH
ncbi:MAG TPA: hypothetical protein VGD76_12175 [Ramlibacter sp.]